MPSDTFEYLIIGGGTTGCVVAGRLAAAGASVAVLEAGKHVVGNELVDIPGHFGKTLGDPELDWCLETVPQPGLDGRKVPLPRGKALGGTSVINSMTWGRASKEEYDDLSRLTANGTDWSWNDLLPFFKSSETLSPPTSSEWAAEHGATFNPEFHGRTGPLRRGFVPWLGESHVPFFKAMNNLGVKTNPDSCNGHNLGVFTLATAIDPTTSRRSHSGIAFAVPQAPKLEIIEGAVVHRIVLEPSPTDSSFAAKSVEFSKNGRVHVVHATKEIILSAGAYQTPKLLELSGIGDQALLQHLGIETRIDLPGVGENLQDHLLVPTSYELKPGIVTGDFLLDPDFAAQELDEYKRTGNGQYASIHSAFSLLSLDHAVTPDISTKALELAKANIRDAKPGLEKGHDALYNLEIKWFLDPKHGQFEFMHVPQFCATAASEPKPKTPYLSLLSLVMRPFSRGSCHARSSNPLDAPLIDPGYLSNAADNYLMMQAIRFADRLAKTEPLASMIVAQAEPRPEVLGDDAALEEYIKVNLETAHHPMGTASMLPRELGGVVGPDLKVYGCPNLRIADASVIPLQLSAHPQATLYAMGEKAAAMILQERALAQAIAPLSEARL